MFQTGREAAAAMRRLADAVEGFEEFPQVKPEHGGPMPGEYQVGAAAILSYLLDCFTGTPKEQFTRDEILVLLNAILHDGEIFTLDILSLFE